MGKSQSKRSVDITTEIKKGADDEITEKMERIEDLDKKEAVNGDATLEEKTDIEKNEIENDKDMTTEKNVTQVSGDITETSNSAETPKEESGSAAIEEISPLAEESIKKSKKEKVKKKWSFRNISFGKKDKQKPTKSEEEAVDDETTATNGPEIDEKSPKGIEDSQKNISINDVMGNSTEHRENGDATEEEINGTEHKEEQPFEGKSKNLTNNTTAEKSGPVQSENTVESSDISEKTEVKTITTTTNFETTISENNSNAGVSKSDKGKSEKSNATEQESQNVDVTNNEPIKTSADNKSILSDATNELSASTNGEITEKILKNGDKIDKEVVEQSKAQIEVNFNTDNKVSAATLDYFPSTSINPSKAQIHNQNLNTTTKNADKRFEIIEDSNVLKLTGTDESNTYSSLRENVCNVENVDSNKQIAKNALLSTENINKSAIFENISDDLSPPPLPISPPPSQVSVFAFKNTTESVKDSIPTNNSETVCSSVEENNEITPSRSEVLPDSTNTDNIPEINEKSEEAINNDNNKLNEDVHKNGIKKQTCIRKEELEENMNTNSVLDNFNKKEEFSIAAEVIVEIADKAVEIVSLQLETNKNILEKNTLQQTDELEKGIEEDDNGKAVLGMENIVKHKELAETNNASECRKKELTKYLTEPSIALDQTNEPLTKSSLIFSASGAIQQAQNEMLILRVEDNFNPTKELANAKDLKDNAAAVEITQDLSLTCE